MCLLDQNEDTEVLGRHSQVPPEQLLLEQSVVAGAELKIYYSLCFSGTWTHVLVSCGCSNK